MCYVSLNGVNMTGFNSSFFLGGGGGDKELGSRSWDCGSWLQVVEAAAKFQQWFQNNSVVP